MDVYFSAIVTINHGIALHFQQMLKFIVAKCLSFWRHGNKRIEENRTFTLVTCHYQKKVSILHVQN